MLRFHSRFEFQVGHSNLLRSKPTCTKTRGYINWLFQKTNHCKELPTEYSGAKMVVLIYYQQINITMVDEVSFYLNEII